jgi:Protein of unknown function (DUF3800)
VILTAYFDESGTHGGSSVTVMAGVLANAHQWERFERDFSKIKKKHGFDVLHTKKFKHKRGDFVGWTDSQRIAVLKELLLLTTTDKRFTEGVTVTLDNAEYEASYKKAADDPRRLRIESKYGLCFRNCLWFFAIEALKRAHRGRPPRLHFVLESGHPNVNEALHIFKEIKQELTGIGCDMLGEITIADKNESNPLMIADFLAHTTYMMATATPNEQRQIFVGQRPLVPQEKHSGVTHLRFKPGGLVQLKLDLIDRLTTKNSVSRRKSGEV